ncbi:MAG: UbiA family prenyltransferase, partial [Thiohalobacterales bacterium]|nr:UbiA family prenyltransferase [Thiohalobacterales bacterium]
MTESTQPGLISSYLGLCKLKVVALIVFTAMVGMFLATAPPGMVPWDVLIFGNLGIGLAASAAAAINHVLDAREDAKMARTSNRPLPQGQVSERNALLFAGAIGLLSMLILVYLVNVLTAVLTFLSLVGYAIVYTMYLKRATPQNIVI